MADSKISGLSAVTTIGDTDEYVVAVGGATKKITGANVKAAVAPVGATYITQTASSGLSAEQALGALGTGILKSTTTTGVLSIAVGSDLPTRVLDVITFTSPVTITGTNEAGATTIATGTTLTYAAVTTRFELISPQFHCGTAGTITFWLYEDGASIGVAGFLGSGIDAPGLLTTYHTPSAGSHTYSIRASRGTADATIHGGAGGAGNYRPGIFRQSI